PYRWLVESMQEGALTLSVDGTILYCNRRFGEMVQIGREKLIGRRMEEFLPADEASAFKSLLLAGRTGASRGELSLGRRDGSDWPIHLAVSPMDLGTSIVVTAIVTDLTQQKQYEELRRSQAALSEADRRKDIFLATLAHELRNPLAPIKNAAELLQ